jgi:hypothetical protein
MLSAFINQQFGGQIWKLTIDQSAGLLFAEIRHDESHTVSFAALHLDTGNTNFKELTLPEKWLSGLIGSFNGIVFLHGYQSAQSPAHKGITAVNGTNGTILWTNYTDAIHSISSNGPVVYNTQVQPPKLFLADAETGKYLRPFDAAADTLPEQDILVPDIINHIPDGFEIPAGNTVQGNIHFIEHNSFRIVSLHLLNNGVLNQILLIGKNGVLVYHDLLNGVIQKLQPESFIIHRHQLIYIKNKTGLMVLNL